MNQKLKEWACSMSGCDGGNIDAETWLCGIEWGAGSRDRYYELTLPKQIQLGRCTAPEESYDWEDSITYPYGRSFAKLYKAIEGEAVEQYKSVASLSGREIFKTNLYPIAFDSTDHELWHKHNLDGITGFPNKHLFNTWCFFNRFPVFSKLREKHRPKLIVGTGINYLRDFLMFFGGAGKIDKLNSGTIAAETESNKHDRTYYWLWLDNQSLLVVIPFFSGRFGLNSNYLLKKMGERIRVLRDEGDN